MNRDQARLILKHVRDGRVIVPVAEVGAAASALTSHLGDVAVALRTEPAPAPVVRRTRKERRALLANAPRAIAIEVRKRVRETKELQREGRREYREAQQRAASVP